MSENSNVFSNNCLFFLNSVKFLFWKKERRWRDRGDEKNERVKRTALEMVKRTNKRLFWLTDNSIGRSVPSRSTTLHWTMFLLLSRRWFLICGEDAVWLLTPRALRRDRKRSIVNRRVTLAVNHCQQNTRAHHFPRKPYDRLRFAHRPSTRTTFQQCFGTQRSKCQIPWKQSARPTRFLLRLCSIGIVLLPIENEICLPRGGDRGAEQWCNMWKLKHSFGFLVRPADGVSWMSKKGLIKITNYSFIVYIYCNLFIILIQ